MNTAIGSHLLQWGIRRPARQPRCLPIASSTPPFNPPYRRHQEDGGGAHGRTGFIGPRTCRLPRLASLPLANATPTQGTGS
eukprot:5454649-Pyramimonas_sp.AAC.1